MSGQNVVTKVVLAALALALMTPVAVIAADSKQWQTTPDAPLSSGTAVNLWNVGVARYIEYGKRSHGINLTWRPKPATSIGRITFARQRRDVTEPLKYGEPLAIHVEGGGYLRYGVREYGINLLWSSTPVYEWEIRGGRSGESISTAKLGDNPAYISDTLFSIYNKVSHKYLAHGKREHGIDLVWHASE